MNYRNLGRTGVKVSRLCLGTMNFGYRTAEEDATTIIHAALDKGINFVDTANFYGQPAKGGKGQGITETIVGKALQGRRDRVVLTTKVYPPTPDYPEDPNAYGLSRRHVIAECEKSLKRLNTDYIDLYQLHRPQADVPIDETLRALDDLVRSGKVRYIGTSMFPAWRITEAIWTSHDLHLNRFVTEQAKYHLLNRRIELELVPMAQQYDIALLAYSPLAGGLLTGKYKRDAESPDDARIKDEAWGDWARTFETDNLFDVVELLDKMAAEKTCTPSQMALAWTAQQPGITSVIIGPRTLEQFEDNLGALDVEVTDDDRKQLDEISPPPSV